MKNFLISFFIIFAFCLGAYIWKKSSAETEHLIYNQDTSQFMSRPSSNLIRIENKTLTEDDVNIEYSIITKSIGDIGDFKILEETALPLKDKILDALLERKTLFQMVKNDTHFNVENPSRYVDCIHAWNESLKNFSKPLTPKEQEHLKERLCESDLLIQYSREKLFKNINVTENEMLTFYNDHLDRFKTPAMAHIRQIVFDNENVAKSVYASINTKNFSKMAEQYSITPEAEFGGVLAPFALGSLPRLFDAVFSMKVGQISQILKSTYGFHVFILDHLTKGGQKTFEESKEALAKIVREKKEEVIYQKWVDDALHAIKISANHKKSR